MTTEEKYLQDVERMLRGIAPAHRQTVLDDLRGHFADAAELGRPVDEVVAGLGAPGEIAERAREEFGTDDSAAERAWWVLQRTAIAIALIVGVVVAFLMPSYANDTETVSSDGTVLVTDGTQNLVQANGLWVALIALVPALIAAVPLVVPRRARQLATVCAAVLLTLMALIGGFTLGGFFLPTSLLAWAAVLVRARLRGRGFALGWRVTGALLTAVPLASLLALLPYSFGMPRRYADYSETGPSVEVSAWAWPVVAVLLLLAVLIACGIRTAGWLLAAIGAAILVFGLFSGGMMTILIVWLGGWWLTIGLAHAVATPARRR